MTPRSSGQEFNAHWAVQLIVSTAQRAGTSVSPDRLASGLASDFPEYSTSELTRMLCAAALDAKVPFAPAHSRSSRQGRPKPDANGSSASHTV